MKTFTRSGNARRCDDSFGGRRFAYMVLGALVHRLDVALHLKDLGDTQYSTLYILPASVCRTINSKQQETVTQQRRHNSELSVSALTLRVSSSAGSGVGVFTEGGTMGDLTASC